MLPISRSRHELRVDGGIDARELAADVEQRLHAQRERRPGEDAPHAAIVLPGEPGEVLGVVRRETRDCKRPATTVAWVGEGFDQRVRDARAEPAALAQSVSCIRA